MIAGAGRGIGRAIALGLAGTGARLVLLARTTGQLEETSGLLRERGVPAGGISVVPADLADDKQRALAAVSALAARHVDILVKQRGYVTAGALRPATPQRPAVVPGMGHGRAGRSSRVPLDLVT